MLLLLMAYTHFQIYYLMLWCYLLLKHSSTGPDKDHPYGHERFETLATLVLSALLFVVGIMVVINGVNIFFTSPEPLTNNTILIITIIISILSKEFLYRLSYSSGKKVSSTMLIANAWHHRSDAISSIIVLIGIIGSLLGYIYLDAIAAIIVGIMIAYIAWKISIPCIKELLDTAIDPTTITKLSNYIRALDDVDSVHSFRSRRSGRIIIIDVHIQVKPFLSVSEGHMITLGVEKILKQELENADIIIHIDPENDENENLYDKLPNRKKVIAIINEYLSSNDCLKGLDKIQLHYLQGKIFIDIYFPISYITDKSDTNFKNKILNISNISPFFADVKLYFSQKNSTP